MWLSSQLWSEPPILIGRPYCQDFRHLAPPQILSKVRGGCWCNSFDLRCPPLPAASLLIQVTCVHNHMGFTLMSLPGQTILDTVLEQWCGPCVPWAYVYHVSHGPCVPHVFCVPRGAVWPHHAAISLMGRQQARAW